MEGNSLHIAQLAFLLVGGRVCILHSSCKEQGARSREKGAGSIE